jgi:acyl carrier protein phosphodiesterase
MNYLAHAYLSFHHPQVLTGNMISDYVKGRSQYDYPETIQAGIRLHRVIDHFTDEHSASRIISNVFRPVYRLYSAAFSDIVYDYFIANDASLFPGGDSLESFAQETYNLLEKNSEWFPQKFSVLFPYMHTQNWLANYRYDWGIERSFQGLGRRAAYLPETAIAFDLFLENKELLHEQYELFFPSVKKVAADTMQQLLKA